MGNIKKPQDVNPVRNDISHPDIFNGVKLVVSLFSRHKGLFNKVASVLRKKFGHIDYESEFLELNKTDYYEDELGPDLIRKFYSFKKLIKPVHLADIKIYTNRVENKFSKQDKRQVNIDPGYLHLAKFVLATTKDQQHRIYLKKGIFAEVTLRYRSREFKAWPWTYPDYATSEYREVFNKIRKIYKEQIQ
jgi:hypothetical protein